MLDSSQVVMKVVLSVVGWAEQLEQKMVVEMVDQLVVAKVDS